MGKIKSDKQRGKHKLCLPCARDVKQYNKRFKIEKKNNIDKFGKKS